MNAFRPQISVVLFSTGATKYMGFKMAEKNLGQVKTLPAIKLSRKRGHSRHITTHTYMHVELGRVKKLKNNQATLFNTTYYWR